MTKQIRTNLLSAMRKANQRGFDPYDSTKAQGKWYALMEQDRYRKSAEARDVAPF